MLVGLHTSEGLKKPGFVSSGLASGGNKILVRRDSDQTVNDSVHHDCLGIGAPLLQEWPFEGSDHRRYATLAVVVVEHVPGASPLHSLDLSA